MIEKEKIAPCKHCKMKTKQDFYPEIYSLEKDGLYYARCPNCSYYSPYEFIGTKPDLAIENWNNTMNGPKGTPNEQ